MDSVIRVACEIANNPRYVPIRNMVVVAGAVAYAVALTMSDYYFIEMVRANVSTTTLLMYLAIERALS